MWGKYSRGYGKIVAVSLLLVLVLSPLAASWPFNFGTKAKTVAVDSSTMEQLNLLIDQLETQLTEQEQKLSNSNATIASLSKELSIVKALLPVSEASYKTLKGEYDRLVAEVAKLEKNQKSDWGGLVGLGGTYTPSTGQIGAEATVGASYKQWTLTMGVGFQPATWWPIAPTINDLNFKTGLQFSF